MGLDLGSLNLVTSYEQLKTSSPHKMLLCAFLKSDNAVRTGKSLLSFDIYSYDLFRIIFVLLNNLAGSIISIRCTIIFCVCDS